MHKITRSEYTNWPDLMEIWEQSVLCGHDFLHPADIPFYRTRIYHEYFPAMNLYHINDNASIAGFMGVYKDMLELLFIRPDRQRSGLGSLFVQFALLRLKANKVEVNEENVQALNFYSKHGYIIVGHSVVKSPNRRYPILHMECKI